MAQQALDVVSLDDQRPQFEPPAAAGAKLNVNLKCAAHQLSVRPISAAMGGRMFADKLPVS
jgi:hypothetical protein